MGQEVNQDLRVKRVRKNLGLGVKMSTMYERIDRGVCLTIPGDCTFFHMLMTSSRVINGFAEYNKVTYFMTYIFL